MAFNRELDRAGWVGTVGDFLQTDVGSWIAALEAFHGTQFADRVQPSQQTAWINSFQVLTKAVSELVNHDPETLRATLIFEYMLPREGGRRPDLVMLAGDIVLVLEFKDFARPLQAHVDQVAAYARDLRHYHAATHTRKVSAFLIPTLSQSVYAQQDGVRVVAPSLLGSALAEEIGTDHRNPIDAANWLNADYAPLPSLVQAARTIFDHEPLPHIRRASSEGIPKTIESLARIVTEARKTGSHHLALVTGVPGAGKTLVGLQFVYATHGEYKEDAQSAVFLSGNAPLVTVLQHALKSRVFVQDVHRFLEQYGGNAHRVPREHIWVYDEAQRAWDQNQVSRKRPGGRSEPVEFLRLGRSMDSWAMLVGLIGEGQEIHLGEESGLTQWNDAIREVGGDWTVHCPERLVAVFPAAYRAVPNNFLDLTASLRSHLAEDVQEWVTAVLGGQLAKASALAQRFGQQGFDAYLTRDLEQAKAYARNRYANQPDKRYGLIASNKAKNLEPYGIRVDWSWARNLKTRIGNWYNDPAESARSCCQFHDTAREFECQGLELDLPIVCWGDDLTWNNSDWISVPQPRSTANDPHQLRVNSYRVLLSRGRDGMIVFVPPTPQMNWTAEALLRAGLLPLNLYANGTIPKIR